MLNVLKIFFRAERTRPWLVLTCLVLAGIAEGIGLSSMLPTMTQMTGGATENSSPYNQMFLDAVAAVGLPPTMTTLVFLLIGGLSAKAILSFFALSYVGYSMAHVATYLRSKLIENLLAVRWSYFTEQRVGRITNTISNDATRAASAYQTAAKFLSVCILAVIYILVALAISPVLAIAGLSAGAAMVVILSSLTRVSRKSGYKQTDRTSDLVTYVTDALNNIKPLKTMERQNAFAALFAKKIQFLNKSIRRQVVAAQAMTYGKELILFNAVGVGIYVAMVYKVPIPELIVMSALFYNVVSIVGKAQQFLQRSAELESAYIRLNDLIDTVAAQREKNPGSKTPTLNQGCRFENVSFAYENVSVIRDVTLDIPVGEITVLQGPSGSGKTTLIDLLTGLYAPDQGRVLIDGVPLTEIDLKQWRRIIGYVPQELALLHDTVLLNVTLGDEHLTEDDAREALIKADAWDFVSSLPEGLMTVVGERGMKFSGGQRQRVALARALVSKPKLLILDEVTSALDPKTEAEICKKVQGLADDYTIVAITHRPAWTEVATSLYRLDYGNLVKVDKSRAVPETA